MVRSALSIIGLKLAQVLIWMLSLVPLRPLHALARPLAVLYRLRSRRKSRIVKANLALAFPQLDNKQRQQLAHDNSVEMLRLVLETGAVWHWSRQRLLAHVPRVEGQALLNEAVRDSRGLLLLGGHQGNWELLTLFTTLQLDFVGLYRAPAQAALQRAITRSRERFGGQLVASGGSAMRRLLRQLRTGGAAGILIDQAPRQGDGAFAPFFDRAALTMTLPHRLARKTGCRIIFGDCARLPRGRGWAIRYREPPAAVYSDDEAIALGAMNRTLSELIDDHRSQYLWRYKRFAPQPEGQPDPYERREACVRP